MALHALTGVPAPAKLNLFLHVTGRRADGYHLLQSVFMLVDWCDTLDFERRPDGALSRSDDGGLPADDLCLRAARALQAATGSRAGAHITLQKRIPSQAGMGGGSSDAATCLLALNRLWGCGLALARLEAIGLGLGADVPFFLRGRNAWVEGIGETIAPLEGDHALPQQQFLVAWPGVGVSTPAIFSDPALPRSTASATLAGFAAHPWRFGTNDLQNVAVRTCNRVQEALDWLGAQGLAGRMTGSGSAVFAPAPAGFVPQAAPAGWQVRMCSNLAIHPLAGWAGQ